MQVVSSERSIRKQRHPILPKFLNRTASLSQWMNVNCKHTTPASELVSVLVVLVPSISVSKAPCFARWQKHCLRLWSQFHFKPSLSSSKSMLFERCVLCCSPTFGRAAHVHHLQVVSAQHTQAQITGHDLIAPRVRHASTSWNSTERAVASAANRAN